MGRRTLINLRHCTFVTLLINFIQAICWHTDSLKHKHAHTHIQNRHSHRHRQGRHTAEFASRETLSWLLKHCAISSAIGYRFGRGNKWSRAFQLNLQIELKRKCINPIFDWGDFFVSHLWLLMQLLMGERTWRCLRHNLPLRIWQIYSFHAYSNRQIAWHADTATCCCVLPLFLTILSCWFCFYAMPADITWRRVASVKINYCLHFSCKSCNAI